MIFGRSKHRGRRTLFLGALATAVFVWAAIDRFGVPAAEMGRLALYCLAGVLLTMVLAACCVALAVGIKALYRKSVALRNPPE